jgi:hypothetical protein
MLIAKSMHPRAVVPLPPEAYKSLLDGRHYLQDRRIRQAIVLLYRSQRGKKCNYKLNFTLQRRKQKTQIK